MKHRKTFGAAAWGLVSALALLPQAASAADFSQRTNLAARSAQAGLGRTELPLLVRRSGAGVSLAGFNLVPRFAQSTSAISTGGAVSEVRKRDHVLFNGPGWFMQVYADGSHVRYRNHAFLDRARRSRARPVAQRLSDKRLAALGRAFIQRQLGREIALGPGEALVPLFTQHEIAGGGSTKKGARPVPEKVLSSTIVFGRTIDGVDVVGPGSKVAVMFANDGTAAGFDYDWPAYDRAGRSQRVLPVAQVRHRAQRLTAAPLAGEGVEVKRVECGYFDQGARRHDPDAVVQAACAYQYSKKTIVDAAAHRRDPKSGHVTSAFIEAIPAGETVERDQEWAQATRLRGEAPAPHQAATKPASR